MVTYIVASKANQPYLAEVSPTPILKYRLVPNPWWVPWKELSWRVSEDHNQAQLRVAGVSRLCKISIINSCYRFVAVTASTSNHAHLSTL